jgi:MFS family permease
VPQEAPPPPAHLSINENSHVAERTPPGHTPPEHCGAPDSTRRIYAARWLVVAFWALFGCLCNYQWDFYAPIAKPVHRVFGWSDGQIESMTTANNLTQIPVCILAAWLFDTYGVRIGSLAMTGAMVIATGLNCIPVPLEKQWLTVARSLFASCCAGFACAPWNLAPPLISATWFPDTERTLATATMLQLAVLGWMMCFMLPPSLVPTDATVMEQHRAIDTQLWSMFIVACVFFLGVWIALPARPPTAPTRSASFHSQKTSWTSGIAQLAKSRQYAHALVCEHTQPLIKLEQVLGPCSGGVFAVWLCHLVGGYARHLPPTIGHHTDHERSGWLRTARRSSTVRDSRGITGGPYLSKA